MDNLKIKGKFIVNDDASRHLKICNYCGVMGRCDCIEATIELSPRGFLEQLTHKQIGKLLDMINLPQPKPELLCEEEK